MILFDLSPIDSGYSPSRRDERKDDSFMYDITVTGHGMFSLIIPVTDKARWAIRALIETQPFQWAGGNLIVGNDCLGGVLAALAPHLIIKSKGGSGFHVAAPAYGGFG